MTYAGNFEPIHQIPFDQGLFIPVLRGIQNVFLSPENLLGRHYGKGAKIPGRFKEGFDIELEITEETEQKTFESLTNGEGVDGGFCSSVAVFRKFKRKFPELEKTDTIFIIRYKVVMKNGHPVIRQNIHLRDRISL